MRSLSIASILSTSSIISSISASVLPQKPLAASLGSSSSSTATPLPLVIWHGLGDNYKAEGLRSVGDLAASVNPGTYTYFIRLDSDPSADRTATFIGNLTQQVEQVCKDIATHPKLANASAINAIGFSQGGQFMRAYVERCNKPPVANLVTFGAQHNGISEFQVCESGDWLCRGKMALLRGNTWSDFVQGRLVPAQYFRNPEELEAYLEHSNFLADLNNERIVKNTTYAKNMKKLKRFVSYMFKDDTVVIPKQSAWFSEVNVTTGKETELKDRNMYKEDWLGLKWLDEKGRLKFPTIGGGHMALSDEVLIDAFTKYFSPEDEDADAVDEDYEEM